MMAIPEVRMRRSLCLLALLALAVSPAAFAKFGISKTRLTLPRTRPAEIPILATRVYLDVRADAPEVRGSYVDTVRTRVADALQHTERELYRLVERAKDGQASVTVSLSSLSAEVRDEIRTEVRYVKVGERSEWDAKKNKTVYKDVYANRDFLVTWRIVEGRLSARVNVEEGRSPRSSDVSSSYSRSFKTEDGIPREAQGEEALREFLVDETGARAAAVVTASPDPVEALLAVNGELKDGNKLAEAGRFDDALARWSARTLKGDTEAARLHNVGVGHEALAYGHPPDSEAHERQLQEAKAFYGKAINLDPDEKYFKDPLQRIEVSLGYADAARRFSEDLDRFRNDGGSSTTGHRSSRRGEGTAERASGVAAGPSSPRTAVPAVPSLRNGSFESNYEYWTLVGKGNVVDDPSRGRVFEAASRASETILEQSLDVPVASGAGLSLDYRVVSGHPGVRAVLEYQDAGGGEHSSSLDVARRAAPGDWSPWTTELSALKPAPTKVTEIRIVSVGGTVRIDNVALTPR
jgi:hypothetical protein